MRDKYIGWLVFLFFVVSIIFLLQIFFLLERPKKISEKKRIEKLVLENNELKKKIKDLLVEKTSLVEEAKIKDEIIGRKPKEIIREVGDSNLKKMILDLKEEKTRLILENEDFNRKLKDMEKRIREVNDILLIKEEKINALKAKIDNKKEEEAILMNEIQEALKDKEDKELKALEEEKIALASRLLSLQEEIAELSKEKESLSLQNVIILKERDALKERLALLNEEKKGIIEDSKKQIEKILKEKDEETSKLNKKMENEKKLASRKSITGNILSMFLLWKK